MRYGRIPYAVLRGDKPMSELDRAVCIEVLREHLEAEYASNPSRNET